MAKKTRAPFARGATLVHTSPLDGKRQEVKYVRQAGGTTDPLIVVKNASGRAFYVKERDLSLKTAPGTSAPEKKPASSLFGFTAVVGKMSADWVEEHTAESFLADVGPLPEYFASKSGWYVTDIDTLYIEEIPGRLVGGKQVYRFYCWNDPAARERLKTAAQHLVEICSI